MARRRQTIQELQAKSPGTVGSRQSVAVTAVGRGRCDIVPRADVLLADLWYLQVAGRSWSDQASMEVPMSDAVYKIVEVVGVSEQSWEDAGRKAVETAAGSLRDLRVAEVVKLDMRVEDGKVAAFRTRIALSFKLEA